VAVTVFTPSAPQPCDAEGLAGSEEPNRRRETWFRRASGGPGGDYGPATAAEGIPLPHSLGPHRVPCPFIPAQAPVLTDKIQGN